MIGRRSVGSASTPGCRSLVGSRISISRSTNKSRPPLGSPSLNPDTKYDLPTRLLQALLVGANLRLSTNAATPCTRWPRCSLRVEVEVVPPQRMSLRAEHTQCDCSASHVLLVGDFLQVFGVNAGPITTQVVDFFGPATGRQKE